MIYSYVRVSTERQEVLRQEKAIQEYCKENKIVVDKEFKDVISGKTFNRENYQEMKETIKQGDVLIIKELDRFGRQMEAIKNEWNYFMQKGVKIIVIDMPLISSDLSGKKTLDMQFISNLVFEVLCYSAQKEREKISQRTREALKAKKESGIVLGRRKRDYSEEEINEIKSLYDNGIKYEEICSQMSISKPTLIKLVKEMNWESRYNKA